MASFLVIAHAPLASAFKALAEHAFPEASAALEAFDVPPGDDVEAYVDAADARLLRLPEGERLLLTDVFGATPCSVARQLAERRGLQVLAGVNVPMLWRALNYRHLPLSDVCVLAVAGATQGIMPLSVTRPQNQALKPAAHDPKDRHHQQ